MKTELTTLLISFDEDSLERWKTDNDLTNTGYGAVLETLTENINNLVENHIQNEEDGEWFRDLAKDHFNNLTKITEKCKFQKKINNKNTYWEQEPLNFFAKKKQLHAFKHVGFWKSLDTLKDKNDFDEMIKKNIKPWII